MPYNFQYTRLSTLFKFNISHFILFNATVSEIIFLISLVVSY